MNLQDRVILTGYRPFSEMPDLINFGDVCVNAFPLTKRTRDIFSAKLVQYLACGKPVISSRLPGIENAINAKESGVIYVESVPEIFEQITLLMQNPKLKAKLERVGRQYAVIHHSYQVVLDKVEKSKTPQVINGRLFLF
jgi:glycosyltransferase involved in cell wall biosynthesis